MRSTIISVLLLSVLFVSMALADEADSTETNQLVQRSGEFIIKVGNFGSGDFTLKHKTSGSESDYETESSYTLGIAFNFRVKRPWMAGVGVNISNVKVKVFEYEVENESLLEFCGLAKVEFVSKSGMAAVRPGVGVGYALMTQTSYLGDSQFITFRANVEGILYTGGGLGFMLDMGFFWTVAGGSDTYDVTAGPMFVIRGGLVM